MTISDEITGLTFFRGRVALYTILKELGIGAGDEVAVQAFTCVAVPEAIMAAGAQPVWVDIETDGFNMDPADLRCKLTLRTRAIIIQHTYGIPATMELLLRVASEARLPVIEDCCHTLVSTYKGKSVGSFGVASFYSFEWGKPIVVGIGGSLVVNDPKLRQRVQEAYENYLAPKMTRTARIQFQYYAFMWIYRPRLYWLVRALFHRLESLGIAEGNYNPMTEGKIAEDFSLRMATQLQKRLANKLVKLDAQTLHSRWVVGEFQKRIQSAAINHPILPNDSDTVFARYPLLVSNKAELLTAAREANVELSEWYATPIHPLADQELRLVHYKLGSCPNAEMQCSRVVTLPVHSRMTKRDVDLAVKLLNEVTR